MYLLPQVGVPNGWRRESISYYAQIWGIYIYQGYNKGLIAIDSRYIQMIPCIVSHCSDLLRLNPPPRSGRRFRFRREHRVHHDKEGYQSSSEEQNSYGDCHAHLAFVHVPCSKKYVGINDLINNALRSAHKGGHVRRDFSRLSSVRTTSMDFAMFGKFAHASSRIFRVGPEVSSWTRNSNLCSATSSS